VSDFQTRLLDVIGRSVVAIGEADTKEQLFERYGLDAWVLSHPDVLERFERFPEEDRLGFGVLIGVIYERLYPAAALLSEER